ncbi:Chs7 protein [Hanseniaspora uvarum]|nr:Chs7 protein [Hanseniaspora uvarum]
MTTILLTDYFINAVFIAISAICQQSNHYVDGMFAMTLSNLLSFMMVYKSWAISTAEDLEFGVNMISEDKTLDQASDKI